MGEFNLLRQIPKVRRDISGRKKGQAKNREIAKQYGFEYFDGTREQGYGGYNYDGRWIAIAEDIVARYDLKSGDRFLDVGCAKGFLVKDLIDVCPGLDVWGLDISDYGIRHCHPDVAGRLVRGSADRLPFVDGFFKAATCINVIHNLDRDSSIRAIGEMERVAPGNTYIQVDAYRDEKEREIFLDWVLTAVTYGTLDFWRDLFVKAGYTGDYFWTIIEADPKWTVLENDE